MASRKSLAEYLGFTRLRCFGVKVSDSDLDTDTDGQSVSPTVSTMSLKENHAALEQRKSDVGDDGSGKSPTRIMSVPESPEVVPLIEMLRREDLRENNTEVGSLENTFMCYVCMGRKNRTALIPCGHTFCGACTRKLCVVGETCPACHVPFGESVNLV